MPESWRCFGDHPLRPDAADVLERVRDRPVCLGLAMTGAERLEPEPQNRLVNQPAQPAREHDR